MTDETRLQAAHGGGHEEASHGIAALNSVSSPAEIVMQLECAGREDPADLRAAYWKGAVWGTSRLMVWLFSDRQPDRAGFVLLRAYQAAVNKRGSLLQGGIATKDMEALERLLAHQSGTMWHTETEGFEAAAREAFGAEEDAEGEREAFALGAKAGLEKLLGYFFADGRPAEPVFAGRRIYSVAKSYYEHLLEGMTLEQMAASFDETNPKASRARWSWRIRSFVNRLVAEAGFVAHARFQKKESTCAKYASAARRTRNRARPKKII